MSTGIEEFTKKEFILKSVFFFLLTTIILLFVLKLWIGFTLFILPVPLICCILIVRDKRVSIFVLFLIDTFMPALIRAVPFKLHWGIYGEIILLFTLLFFLLRTGIYSKKGITKNSVTRWLLIWFLVQALQIANPNMITPMSYILFMRGALMFLIMYFVFQSVFQNKKYLAQIINGFIFLIMICALYTLKQEYFGLSSSELQWINSTEKFKGLMITWGKIRKFSFMGGPIALGVSTCLGAFITFVKVLETSSIWKKLLYFICTIVMLMAMAHTSTRTAYFIFPVGVLFYLFLNFNRKNFIILICSIVLGFGLVTLGVASGNRTMYIISSAFDMDDPSLIVRMENQKILKSIISAKPFGSGLGSCGAIARLNTPWTFLANFPPDSEFVRAVIDVGWIGLIVYFTFLFNVLRVGINEFFRAKSKELKLYFSIIISLFLMLVISCYPQEIYGARPLSMIFTMTYCMISQFKYLNSQAAISEDRLGNR